MTAMRIVAYLSPNQNAEAVRAHLLGLPGVAGVGCRAGRLWDGRCEPGWDRCWAGDYPGIRAAYQAAGCAPIAADPDARPLERAELTELPPAPVVTIICPGAHVLAELAAHPPEGAVLVVNEAAHLLAAFDYFLANDGFIDRMATVRVPCVRVTRHARLSTLPAGPWYALERLGVRDGLFSVRCALLLAERALGARRIVLIGHDCLPGSGTGASEWSEGLIEACRNAVVGDCINLARRGIAVEHVRWNGTAAYLDRYDPPPQSAPERS